MKINKGLISLFIAGILLFSLTGALSGCSAKKPAPAGGSSAAASQSAVASQSSAVSQAPETVQVKSADGSIAITVPTGWNTNDTSIWPTASIAVSNDTDNDYVVVIKKAKTDYAPNLSISGYVTGMKLVFNALLTNPVWGDSSSTSIGGLSGLTTQLSGNGKETGTALVYWISVVEDSNNFYEIAGYSHSDKATANQPVVQNVISSFKVLG